MTSNNQSIYYVSRNELVTAVPVPNEYVKANIGNAELANPIYWVLDEFNRVRYNRNEELAFYIRGKVVVTSTSSNSRVSIAIARNGIVYEQYRSLVQCREAGDLVAAEVSLASSFVLNDYFEIFLTSSGGVPVIVSNAQLNITFYPPSEIGSVSDTIVATQASSNIFNERIGVRYEIIVQNTAISRQLSTELYRPVSFGAGSSVTVNSVTGEILIATGAVPFSSSILFSKRVGTYRAGFSLIVRFASLFGPPSALCDQLCGVSNGQSGIYFGYKGTSFGVMYETGRALHAVRIRILTGATGAGTITITLNGTVYSVPRDGFWGNASFTAWQIFNYFRNTSAPWNATAENGDVFLISLLVWSFSRAFSASFGANAGTGTLTTEVVGQSLVQTFIPFEQCNGDRTIIATIDPMKYNMYSIEYGYYGSSPFSWKVLSPTENMYKDVHIERFANIQTQPNLTNPNMYVTRKVVSLGSATPTTIKTLGSFMAYIGQERGKGKVPNYGITASRTFTGEQCILNLKHRDFVSGAPVYSEFILGLASFSTVGTRSSVIKIYRNPTQIGAGTSANFPIWVPVATSSIALYDTNATTITTTTPAIISFVLGPQDSENNPTFRIRGYTLESGIHAPITATNAQSVEVLVGIQIIEQTN